MKIKIRIANENDIQIWDNIVDSSPDGSLFHKWKWLKIVEKHTKTDFCPIIGEIDNNIVAIFPVYVIKKFGLSFAFSPPPGSGISYLGPILVHRENIKQSKKESIMKNFLCGTDSFLENCYNCKYFNTSLVHDFDPRPFKWAAYSLHPSFDYHILLNRSPDTIWNSFDSNLRRQIRKTEKNNFKFVEGNEKEIELLYGSLKKRYEEQKKVVTVKKEYLFDLFKEFSPGHMRIFTAYQENEFSGGIIELIYNNKIAYWIGAAKPNPDQISSNDFIQWEAIKWSKMNGLLIYEEIGAGTENLAFFKAKYNPILKIRYNVIKNTSTVYPILEKIYANNFIKKLFWK